jgi:hypothetical protein
MAERLTALTITKPMDIILHQCCACGYASALKTNVTRHRDAKCPGADVLTGTVQMAPVGHAPGQASTKTAGPPAGRIAVDGDHNRVNSHDVNCHNNNISITIEKIYVGSEAEKQALFDLLRSPECLKELDTLSVQEMPAALFRMLKGADAPPQLKNIRVDGDKVRELRGPGREVAMARAKFVKKTVGNMIDAVDAVRPESTPTPDIVRELQSDIRDPSLKVGAKRKLSKAEAARAQAACAAETYRLDAEGKRFLAAANSYVDKELTLYAND